VILGVFEEDAVVNMGLVQDKEINVVGTPMYTKEDYREAIRIADQNPHFSDLITHRFPLKDVEEAFGILKKGPKEAIKVVLEVGRYN
jgi:L-iditol 2-dehydrogenase